MENEIWKDVIGYEGYYQISNLARVKCLERIIERREVKHKNHTKYFKLNEQIKRTAKDKNGYEIVSFNKGGKSKMHKVHRLVAQAFIDNPDNKPQVNHKDGNTSNNQINNLEWMTCKENNQHAFLFLNRKERIFKIEYVTSKPVTQYSQSGEKIKQYKSRAEASRLVNINQSSICKCTNGKQKTAAGFIWKNE